MSQVSENSAELKVQTSPAALLARIESLESQMNRLLTLVETLNGTVTRFVSPMQKLDSILNRNAPNSSSLPDFPW